MTRPLQRGEKLVMATHNPGKLREIEVLVAPHGSDFGSSDSKCGRC